MARGGQKESVGAAISDDLSCAKLDCGRWETFQPDREARQGESSGSQRQSGMHHCLRRSSHEKYSGPDTKLTFAFRAAAAGGIEECPPPNPMLFCLSRMKECGGDLRHIEEKAAGVT